MVRVVENIRALCSLTLRVALVFELVLVFLVTTIAFGVMRLGLASTTAVLTLLDGATLRVDMVQVAICEAKVSICLRHIVVVVDDAGSVRFTGVVATAHSVTLDAGRASPFLAIDDRHSVQSRPKTVVAGGSRRPSGSVPWSQQAKQQVK
jgi:hypothetical protein